MTSQHEPKLTTIIVSTLDVPWVAPTIKILRDQGMKVVRLHGFGALVTTIMFHEDRVPKSWDSVRARIEVESPNARIVIIPRDETRSAAELAAIAAGS